MGAEDTAASPEAVTSPEAAMFSQRNERREKGALIEIIEEESNNRTLKSNTVPVQICVNGLLWSHVRLKLFCSLFMRRRERIIAIIEAGTGKCSCQRMGKGFYGG